MCPECGTSVRTTLLAVIDPMAKELRPIHHPALVGTGLAIWATGALLAVLCVWFLRAEDFLGRPRAASPVAFLAYGVVAFTALSGFAALVLVHPHDGIPLRQRWSALLGVLAYVPLCVFLFYLHVRWDGSNRPPYGYQSEILPERLVLRLCISLLLVAILLLLRPNARLLSGRWVLMRLGAVDRQTMFSMAMVIALWSVGDGLRYSFTLFQGTLADVLRFAGTSSVVVGSLLFTVGLASLVLECWRLRPIIAQPPLDLEELTSHREPATPQAASTIPAR